MDIFRRYELGYNFFFCSDSLNHGFSVGPLSKFEIREKMGGILVLQLQIKCIVRRDPASEAYNDSPSARVWLQI